MTVVNVATLYVHFTTKIILIKLKVVQGQMALMVPMLDTESKIQPAKNTTYEHTKDTYTFKVDRMVEPNECISLLVV